MLPAERRRLIAERLRQHGSVSVSGLEAEFRISPMTARRDLDELERRGVARRTHGGAVLPGCRAMRTRSCNGSKWRSRPRSGSPRRRSG